MADKVSNSLLLEAGLAVMRDVGKPLERVPTSTRAMKYKLANGETVRVRTCNDHVLVVLAEDASPSARLNIEGTDHLLIVMPETPRREGSVIAYLVPTQVAVQAARSTHAEWLATAPSTKGNNRTWNLWFDDDSPKAGGYARKWSAFRLPASGTTELPATVEQKNQGGVQSRSLGSVIAQARQAIAVAAGVPIEAVKISVALE